MDRGAGDESAQVFRRDRDQPLPRFERRPGDMRRDQAVFRAQQRVSHGDRLDRDDVDRRAADLPRIQRVGDVAFIQDWPAAGVDQDDAVLHFRDAIPINESELSYADGLFGVEIRFLDDRLVDTLDAWLAWGGVLRIGSGGPDTVMLAPVEGQVIEHQSWEELTECTEDTTWEIVHIILCLLHIFRKAWMRRYFTTLKI